MKIVVREHLRYVLDVPPDTAAEIAAAPEDEREDKAAEWFRTLDLAAQPSTVIERTIRVHE